MHYAVLLALCCVPSPAEAYLDPGTGSYVFQVLIGVLAGAVFGIKNYWVQIKAFFQRFKK